MRGAANRRALTLPSRWAYNPGSDSTRPMPELAAGFQSLTPEYQLVIRLAQEQHHLAVTPLQTLAGGWSGALIFLVSVAQALRFAEGQPDGPA